MKSKEQTALINSHRPLPPINSSSLSMILVFSSSDYLRDVGFLSIVGINLILSILIRKPQIKSAAVFAFLDRIADAARLIAVLGSL